MMFEEIMINLIKLIKRYIFSVSILFLSVHLEVGAQTIGDPKIYYGAAYYPESWPRENVKQDIEHMMSLNMNVVRMAEFAWSTMEPEEGNYQFEWLHGIIEELHAAGIDVVLGTPTATPPAWMWEKYPDIALIDDEGLPTMHGARNSTNYNSPSYRRKSVEIIEKIAAEFGDKPGVIGWQTDNEFHPNPDYSQVTREKWHQWLKEKYQTTENLNQVWATELWSQTYQDFSQIPMPVSRMWHHMSLRFDWKQFNSDMVAEYQDLQLKAIRKYSDLPITHDGMPMQDLDYYHLMKDLDFIAFNNYFGYGAYHLVMSNYDRVRGFGKGFHWLFETAPNSSAGKNGRTFFLHRPEGSMRAAIWINYALGGQGAMFWLWRQHRAAQEMVHGSILSAWGKPVANYDDLQNLGRELRQVSDFLIQNPVAPAEMAILYSHQSQMGFEIEEYANDLNYYWDWTRRFYLPFHDAYLHRDVIGDQHDLAPYKVLFVPLMPLMKTAFREKLKNWVQKGGTLILGPMSGYRSEYWTAFTDKALGDLNQWTGIEVDTRLPIGTQKMDDSLQQLHLKWNLNIEMSQEQALLWSESLSSASGKVLATYQNGMQSGKPAIIETKVGSGKVIQLGTDPGQEAIHILLMKYAREAGITPLAEGEEGILVVPRVGKGEGVVLVNYTGENKEIKLKENYREDIISGKKYSSEAITLQPYDVMILKK